MNAPDGLWRIFDVWVLRALQILLAVGIVAAIVVLGALVIRAIPLVVSGVESVHELQRSVQALFAGTLLVVLGLELMATLRGYFGEHHTRVEFLMSVALIAVARHIIQYDYEHADAATTAAIALLVLALAMSYVGIRRFLRRDQNPSTL